ncbi:brachyurin-like [Uranotaenia lowii]|uniref:brachyurin-like n=1 Tax=Uranotaenia lowii TaxID=190385 RepID=UPI00247A2E35|nr:brachyurin-like [Uranotaenia lowii]
MKLLTAILALGLVASATCYECKSTGNTEVTANGEQSRNGQFPHHALIVSTFPDKKRYCSGAMVSRKFVITVAQCVEGSSKIEVTLGAQCLLDGGDNKFRYKFTALEHFVRSGYNYETFENDIALVKFTDDNIRLPPWIKPIELPEATEEHLHDQLLTSGYGMLNYDTTSAADFLEFTQLTVLNHETCQQEFEFVTPESGRFCAQREEQEPNCVSDVGSPLVFKREGYKQYTLVGLTSFGQKFACEKGNPGALQEVSAHVEWIREIIGEATEQ